MDAMFLAMAIVLGLVESFIPFFVPGVRLGLANVIVLILLYRFSVYEAALVDILRVLVVALLRGTFLQMPFYMSLGGAVASFLVMLLGAKVLKRFLTVYGTSLLGAYFHSLAQVVVACLFLENWAVMYYFPVIALLSMASGLLSAFLASLIFNSRILDGAKKKYEGDKKGD